MLPGGDQTEIGEKGINLSGGQKQRVSVARSVYSNGSLYLLDDPLSAVDAHVGKHMFEQVIGPRGLLKNKTRLLVTHSVSFLPQMDSIVVMKDGVITETGSYAELLAQKGAFADFLVQYLSEKKEEGDPETESELDELQQQLEQTLGRARLERQLSRAATATAISELERVAAARRSTAAAGTRTSRTSRTARDQPDQREAKAGEKLIDEERAEEGGVRWSVYAYYARSIGYLASLASFAFYVAFQGFSVGANMWLSKWSDDPLATTDEPTRNKYLTVYGVLGFLQSLSIMLATVCMAYFTLNAATKLHRTMLARIVRSPMSFYDTTPLGRILNRFSKDIDIVDNQIPMNARMMFSTSRMYFGHYNLDVVSSFMTYLFTIALHSYSKQRSSSS